MNKKSHKAIRRLDNLLSKLQSISTLQQGKTFQTELQAELEISLGKDSPITKRIHKLYFGELVNSDHGFLQTRFDETKKSEFKDLISSAKSHIQSHGVFKETKGKNFLHSWTNWQIIVALATLISALLTAGIYLGKIENLGSKTSVITQQKKSNKDSTYEVFEQFPDSTDINKASHNDEISSPNTKSEGSEE